MTSLNEVAFLLAEKLPKPEGTPSVILTEMLKFTVLYYRAMFLRRDYTENLRFPEEALQDLGELETVLVDRTESSLVTSGLYVRRTVTILPTPIRLKGWQTFFYVGSMDRLTPYTEVNPQELVYRLHNKRTGKTACYYYANGYLYIINATPKYINVKYMLDDPREASLCENADYSDHNNLYIPRDMLNGIVTGILSGELRTLTPPPSAASEVTIDGKDR